MPKFSISKFFNTIREKREISKFKTYLKYDKDFPKNNIESLFTNTNFEDLSARKTFYLTTKFNDFLPKGISKETTVEIMSKVNK